MHARIEFKYMSFFRGSKEFRLLYKIEEFSSYELEWEEIIKFELPTCSKVKECLIWLKNNLYEVYEMLDLEIPFEAIEFKFQRRPKSMGVDLYE